MNHIEKAAEQRIKSYFEEFSSKGFSPGKIEKLDYHFEFSVARNKDRVKIQVYFGKKGVKTILQGDQNSDLYIQLYNDINSNLFAIEKKEFDEPLNYIGTDESGKGDYFGPLVVAGVAVDQENIKYLKTLGVKDSKELSDSAIKKVASEIRKISSIKSNVISIYPKKYNELYSRVGNVNMILGWAHAKVIENILENFSVEEVISDKFGDEKYIANSLQEHGKKITLHQVTKAERYTAVAAASILARDRFNSWFKHETHKLGFELPKGASESCEAAAKQIIVKIGNHSLKDFAKLHFKNTNRLDVKIN